LQWKQNDRGLLLEAIRSLRACSRLAGNSPLGRDARHNLELARLFLNRLPEPSEAEQPPEEDPGTSENFVPRKQPLDRQQPRAEPGDDPPQGQPNRQTGQPTDKGQEQPRKTEQPSPSSAPKPDAGRERAKLRPRSREEALRELRRLEAEILREYRADSELNTTRTHGEKVKDH
jgi:outer membrane biosynthesis protein TonB